VTQPVRQTDRTGCLDTSVKENLYSLLHFRYRFIYVFNFRIRESVLNLVNSGTSVVNKRNG